MVKQFFALLMVTMLSATQTMAQPVDELMENTLRGSNKLVAVIVVLSIILIGIVVFLFAQESRIRKLERELSDKKP